MPFVFQLSQPNQKSHGPSVWGWFIPGSWIGELPKSRRSRNQTDFIIFGKNMATKQQDNEVQDRKKENQQRDALIGKQVMNILGQPGDLQRLQVRFLWGDYYRVNIFVGVDPASAKVAHSFFLVSDGVGNIVTSTPHLSKKY
jgi:hypothetical protein